MVSRILKRGSSSITSSGSMKKSGGVEKVGLQSSLSPRAKCGNVFPERFKRSRNNSHGVFANPYWKYSW